MGRDYANRMEAMRRANLSMICCRSLLWVYAFIGMLMLASCAQTSPPDVADPLAYSLERWQERKAADGNHYMYDSTFLSYFGFGSMTTLEVKDDQVIARSYTGFDENGVVTEEWTERGAEIGSHESGEPARTVEQVYDECRNTVLTKSREENYVNLGFANDILQFCTYAPRSCIDDCAVGVSIENPRFMGRPE